MDMDDKILIFLCQLEQMCLITKTKLEMREIFTLTVCIEVG
jgi:hypothetical protein